jgi:hypothetical protein
MSMASKLLTISLDPKLIDLLSTAKNRSGLISRLLCGYYKLDPETLEPLDKPKADPDKPKVKPGKIPREQAILERRGHRGLGDKKARYYYNSKGEMFHEFDDAEPFDVSPERADDWAFYNKGE